MTLTGTTITYGTDNVAFSRFRIRRIISVAPTLDFNKNQQHVHELTFQRTFAAGLKTSGKQITKGFEQFGSFGETSTPHVSFRVLLVHPFSSADDFLTDFDMGVCSKS